MISCFIQSGSQKIDVHLSNTVERTDWSTIRKWKVDGQHTHIPDGHSGIIAGR